MLYGREHKPDTGHREEETHHERSNHMGMADKPTRQGLPPPYLPRLSELSQGEPMSTKWFKTGGMTYRFFGRPSLIMIVEVDREQWHRRVELGLPE